jgi:hypothetical protein
MRWDVAVRHHRLLLSVDTLSGWLTTTVVDLRTGQRGDTLPIAEHGKFPSVTSVLGGGWLMAWCGPPALPVALQREGEGPEGASIWLSEKADRAIWTKHEQTLERLATQLGDTAGFDEWKSSATRFVAPFAPVWLGVLDAAGRCVHTYGPLGLGPGDNLGPRLAMKAETGLLLWRRVVKGGDFDEGEPLTQVALRELRHR